jgi:hypothetical protein
MILLNFSHPLTAEQRAGVEALAKTPITRVIDAPAQFDHQQPFVPQLEALLARVPLAPAEWQNESILVNPPSLNYITAMLLAELHGRMGYFPTCIRLRPVKDALPPRFEPAELLNLQALRDAARAKR